MSEVKDDAGFSLLGILIAVMIIGIMATVAVPRFNSVIASANTAKVQADLTTLDPAIAIYQTEKGTQPANISDLSSYVTDLDNLKPPQGTCNLRDGTTITVSDQSYALSTGAEKRATCAGHTAGDFGK